ncbi:hypothetical protein MMC21_007523 [Puttea exsequens]|nr:hypothetical protein [Puttea exsequens]
MESGLLSNGVKVFSPGITDVVVFADNIGAKAFYNVTMNTLELHLRFSNMIPAIGFIRQVYSETAQGSPLRKLVVHQFRFLEAQQKFCNHLDDYPPEFLKDFIREQFPTSLRAERGPVAVDLNDPKCTNHMHDDGETCAVEDNSSGAVNDDTKFVDKGSLNGGSQNFIWLAYTLSGHMEG